MPSPVQKFAEFSAVGFGLGLARRGPGTVGSLGGLLSGWLIYTAAKAVSEGYQPSFYAMAVFLLICLAAFAYWSITRAEASWGTHDEGKIVIDEFAGQAIAVAFFEPSALCYISAFIFFRLLDIWKPGPIGWADEHLPGAAGTLFDDLIAGAGAAGLTWLLITVTAV